MLEILFILLMLGMIGATVYIGMQERKSRLKSVKSKKTKLEGKPAIEVAQQPDDFGNANAGDFEFNPDEFK